MVATGEKDATDTDKSSPDSPKKKGAQKIHGLGFGRGCRFLALLYGA